MSVKMPWDERYEAMEAKEPSLWNGKAAFMGWLQSALDALENTTPEFLNGTDEWDTFDQLSMMEVIQSAVQFGHSQAQQQLAELPRLRSAVGHMEQELHVLRSREMNLDDIAEYTESIQRLKESNAEKDAEIERLKGEQLRLIRAYDHEAEEFDFPSALEAIQCAAQIVNGMQEIAKEIGSDPEGCLFDTHDTVLGILNDAQGKALDHEAAVRELVEALRTVRQKLDTVGCVHGVTPQLESAIRIIDSAIAKHGEGM